MTPGVPQLLERLRAGDESALNELVTLLYDELHRIAGRQLRVSEPDTLCRPRRWSTRRI